MSQILIYGATGYTGVLCAEQAAARGLKPVLAGRNRERLETLGRQLGLEWRTFALDVPARVAAGLEGIAAVLHAAGPFSATSRPMAEACLATGAHYIDITGEIDVFEALAARDAEAKAAGIMLLPGAGFDVVPSDCLAAHVAQRLPDANRLCLSIGGLNAASQGTLKTMLEGLGQGTRSRKDGRIVETRTTRRATADFGAGERATVAISWGDVATAWHTTRIPDIEVYFEATGAINVLTRMPALLRRLLATAPSQRVLKRTIDAWLPAGPSPQQRRAGRAVFVAEASNARGDRVVSRLVTPEAYTLTALTAVEAAHRAASGNARPGFQTPALAFGAGYVTEFEGVRLEDV